MTARRVIARILQVGDKAIDVVLWLHHAVMLYICLVWLLPLFAAILIMRIKPVHLSKTLQSA